MATEFSAKATVTADWITRETNTLQLLANVHTGPVQQLF
jgi:hypothetical protein